MADTARAHHDSATARSEIRSFLASFVNDPAILDASGLISRGLLDSLATVELIAFIESRFGIEVEDDDLEIENFDGVDAVASFVQRKQERH